MRDTSLIFQGLTDLHTSRVEESEIDELGHLSVPFYEERALRASRILAEVHGLSADDCQDEGVELTVVDGFMRNYREQFLNAPLLVRAGPHRSGTAAHLPSVPRCPVRLRLSLDL